MPIPNRADLSEAQLRQAGLRFEQAETFFIKPKSDLVADLTAPVQP